MKKIVIFGAGNIGRSFVAQLFSRAGYEIIFIEINPIIIDALNKNQKYKIIIKDVQSKTILVENVRGISSKDSERVISEVSSADFVATSVGSGILQYIYKNIAEGILLRKKLFSNRPLDIIICENLRNASKEFYNGLKEHLPSDFPDEDMPGFVETSIGKMVPIMREEDVKDDPLLVYAEDYNTLIADKKGFKGELPNVNGLVLKENMKAYVDRKLFIHNLGHSAVAYLGYVLNPELKYIWEAIEILKVEEVTKSVMWESANSLIKEYPNEFNEYNMREHINDLLRRFKNRFLNDSIYRVGRDVQRKLSSDDRLVGAIRLDIKHNVDYKYTAMIIASAMLFRARDESGKLFSRDEEFVNDYYSKGIQKVLIDICKFNKDSDKEIIKDICLSYKNIMENKIF